MLHGLSLPLIILYSVRQGDPLAMLLFLFYVYNKPLRILQRDLVGLYVGLAHEANLRYVDDVAVLSTDEADLEKMISAPVAILNRN
jgi:hypothetical protein